MNEPKKWSDVYPYGTKEGDEEAKFFKSLARHPKYDYRSVGAIVKATGLDKKRVEEIIDKYVNKISPPLLFAHPSNEDHWGYWERCKDRLQNDKLDISEKDKDSRIKDHMHGMPSMVGDIEIDECGTSWYQNGKLHREDGPAIEWHSGTKSWYQNGKLHRLDGPAVEYTNGYKYWYPHGKLHRLDGPAVEKVDGTKKWYQNDKLHRIDGPAIEDIDGTKCWYQHGKLHRLDGPAVEKVNGYKEWWQHGQFCSHLQTLKTEVTREFLSSPLKDEQIVHIRIGDDRKVFYPYSEK